MLRYISISTWLLSIAFSVPPVLGWSVYNLESNIYHCTNSWRFNYNNLTYLLTCVIFGFALPVAIIIVINIILLLKIRELNSTAHVNKTVSVFIIASMSCFGVAWLPLVICGFIELAVGHDAVNGVISKAILVTKITLVCETLLFLLMNKDFHEAAKTTKRQIMQSAKK